MGRKQEVGGGWMVSFADGETVETGYYPNPRMAVAEAINTYREKHGRAPPKVKRVKWKGAN